MPLYTYKCDSCGVQFDRQQKFTDQPLTKCPECNKKALHKVYSAVGIVFKGSGFYATDHRSPSGMTHSSESDKPAAEVKPEAKKEKDKPAEKKTESKSESASSKSAE